VWARYSAHVQTGTGAYPASCTMGTGSFPGVKRPRRGVDHPPPCSAEVKERVELYLYSPSGPSWPVIGWTLPLLLPFFSYGSSAPWGPRPPHFWGFTITLLDTPHSVGLLWTSDQPLAETSTWEHNTHKRQTSMPRWDSNPRS
jgi:hypothetical protein